MRAWTFQDHRQKKKLGSKAPWSVGWIDPDGRRRSKKMGSKSMAGKFSRKIEGELAAGTFKNESRKQWGEFVGEYESIVMARWRSEVSRVEARRILAAFGKLASGIVFIVWLQSLCNLVPPGIL